MITLFKFTFVFFTLFCLAQTAAAATYTVTKTADTNDGACDADCSLREAIAAANASAENDMISFSINVFSTPQTIVLTGNDLIITNNGSLTIIGRGANFLTISGDNRSRVFTNKTGATTAISFLRVTGGNGIIAGGGIYNEGGNLTLTGLVITGNVAGFGGGLDNISNGTLTLRETTVSDNTAGSSGGGMYNGPGSTVNIINSTFSRNIAHSPTTNGGGGLRTDGAANIANSTFSGNIVLQSGRGGGIFYDGTSLTLNNVTIVGNIAPTLTGGIFNRTVMNSFDLRNSIIANNSGGDVVGKVTSFGNNLIGAASIGSGFIDSDLLNQNPLLAPLANNGGQTQTHALLPNSPAINAGNNCVVNGSCVGGSPFQPLTTDQRGSGFPRQFGANVDIGAFEVNVICSCGTRALFDFDGDGKTDYTVFRPANNFWYLQRSTAGFSAVQFGNSTDKPVPADFDGDGKTDIAVWRESLNSPSYFYILNSSNNTFRAEQFGSLGDDPRVVGDWDGDDKADLAVYRNAIGIPENPAPTHFFYRPSGTPGVAFRAIQWGNIFDRAVRGDFDGDGKQDAAVFRPSTRTWYVLQSSNNQPLYQPWGLPEDKLVPADYDGDGRTDIAIFRNGLWAILQSSNNQPLYQNWGLPNDIPVPGDYDGDGRADFAVWRNGTYFVFHSGNNQFTAFQFGSSSDVPIASAFVP
ncbi:MAG TPA: choice-of-anchor Q domain-containing protein [Pyrinomonadaceae bacterium]|jgi:CSLREA domain-containing protein